MTNPDDPRERPSERPWQDGTAEPPNANPEGEQPTQAWQQYPPQQYPDQQYPDQQTQQYPPQQYPDQQTQQYPTQQYPTQQYPGQGYQQYPDSPPFPDQSTQQYGYPQQPYQQPNPTQALPTYDPNQHYAANQQFTDQQYPPGQYGDGHYGDGHYGEGQAYGPPPSDTGGPAPGDKGPRKWIPAMVALAALAVIVLAGILVLTNQRSEPSTSALPNVDRSPSTSFAPLPTIPPSQSLVPPSAPQDLVPGGIPEILGNTGAAIGTITAIDGPTLLLDGIDGAPVTVLVTPQTQVLSLSGFDVSSLTVGSLVVVNGTSVEDGTITADVIVETPDLGG